MSPSVAERNAGAGPAPSLAIIVPVGPGDDSWHGLVAFLATVPETTEIVFAGCEMAPENWPPRSLTLARWLQAARGRARQANAGSIQTGAEYLWWLHADSRPAADAFVALTQALSQRPDDLHWFALRFFDGPYLAKINAAGANWRSRRWQLPFGDQGLCMARASFERLGGFDESLTLGEDLSLVVRARRAGIALNEVPSTIATSARRYRRQGWLRTSIRHLWLTWRLSRAERARDDH